MRCVTLRALAAQSLLVLLLARLCIARETTITLTSTSTVLTSTTTVTLDASTFQSVTTETTAVAGNPSQPTDSASASATGAMSYDGQAFQSAVLNSTNYYRAQHQASSLSWNSTLATFANDYAQKCIWQHSVCSPGPCGSQCALLTCAGRPIRREPCRRLLQSNTRYRCMGG